MEHTKGGATADVSAQNAGSEPKTLAAGQPAEQAAGQAAGQLTGQPSLLEVACARPLSADEVAREQQQYAAQFVQLDREAWYTLGAALITTVIFWGAIALTHDSLITVGYLPLWFALSCLSGYVFSVVIVVALV